MHFSPYIWIFSIPFYPKSISSSLKTMAALIPRPRTHLRTDSRSRSRVVKARPATCHGWCHSFYLTSPQMMFPSVPHISEAAGIDGILHPASWHIVFWVEKTWKIQSEPLSGRCNNRNHRHRNLLAPRAPAMLLTRPCQLHVLQASPSLSVPSLQHHSTSATTAAARWLARPAPPSPKLPRLLRLEDSQAPMTNRSSPGGDCT